VEIARNAAQEWKHSIQIDATTHLSSDVLNVSGRFNSEELSRDMTVGDDVKDEPFFEEGKKHSSAECFSSYWKNGLFNLRCEEPWKGKISDLDPSP